MAIDVGLKRIGVATLVAGIALASEPIMRKNRDQAASDVSAMLKAKTRQSLLWGS